MIELAYLTGEKLGLAVWVEDEAGPYQTVPYPGQSWQPEQHPIRQPHEYIRNGTAKMFTPFHPATGELRVKGVTQSTNAILHPWVQEQIGEVLKSLPEKNLLDEETNRKLWTVWQSGLSKRITLTEKLPALRMLLIWDNLQGHYTPEMVLWLFRHGVMPLYTPLGGSWLNMAESIQRIIVRRALEGQSPETPDQIITWLEAVACGWNSDPTPFEWGGARSARRERSRARRHALGGSGACIRRLLRSKQSLLQKWHTSCQVTH
ncbi:MAG: transposase [Anaerolineales bacterium]|nr:transposase [Anaerolineales bacterium]